MSSFLKHWAPACLVMLIIFLFSSRSASELPNFNWADLLVKKGSHMIGYGFLAFSYLRGFSKNEKRYGLAWILAILYAITDEFHQSFVPGRHPSIWDVLIFDNVGAAAALSIAYYRFRKTNSSNGPSHENSDSK